MLAPLLVLAALEMSEPKPLKWDPKVHPAAMIALGSFWALTEVGLKDSLAPPQCRWCATNGFDDGIRKSLVWGNTKSADTLSNIGVLATPLLMFALDGWMTWSAGGDWKDWLLDVTLMLEATFATTALGQTTKFIAGRERPFVSVLSPAQKATTDLPNDNNLSFFSSHASFTAAFAASAGAIALLRGYHHPWLSWLLGGAMSLMTGFLRIAADKHYFTDVATGWLVGAGIGLAVPLLFHSPDTPVTVAPGPDGIGVAARW